MFTNAFHPRADCPSNPRWLARVLSLIFTEPGMLSLLVCILTELSNACCLVLSPGEIYALPRMINLDSLTSSQIQKDGDLGGAPSHVNAHQNMQCSLRLWALLAKIWGGSSS